MSNTFRILAAVSMPWMGRSVMDEPLRFVVKLLDGEAMTDVGREFGISRKTALPQHAVDVAGARIRAGDTEGDASMRQCSMIKLGSGPLRTIRFAPGFVREQWQKNARSTMIDLCEADRVVPCKRFDPSHGIGHSH
jgi:hypothetical protein